MRPVLARVDGNAKVNIKAAPRSKTKQGSRREGLQRDSDSIALLQQAAMMLLNDSPVSGGQASADYSHSVSGHLRSPDAPNSTRGKMARRGTVR